MCFLCIFARRVEMRLFWKIRVAEALLHEIARCMDRLACDVRRVGAHVGNQTDAIAAEIDTFIKLLRDAHRAIG